MIAQVFFQPFFWSWTTMEDLFGLLLMDIYIVKLSFLLIYASFKATSTIEVGKKMPV
jgi:hypothetical protein